MGLGESKWWPTLCRSGFARVALGLALGGMMLIAGSPAGAVELRVRAAERVYYADPATATAGAYFLKVADRLGVGDEVRTKGHAAHEGPRAARKR